MSNILDKKFTIIDNILNSIVDENNNTFFHEEWLVEFVFKETIKDYKKYTEFYSDRINFTLIEK